jgi:hypothetical protein
MNTAVSATVIGRVRVRILVMYATGVYLQDWHRVSYMHSGIYGMYALQESVRQTRDIAPAPIPDAKISVCHGVGGMFAASGTIIMSNQGP